MGDNNKTKKQLIKDVDDLRQRVDELKKSETWGKGEGQLHRKKLEGVLEMAGAVCHEMNQPMQVILGNSDLLLMHIPENDQISDKITKIRDEIERIRTITSKLMSITRYETKDYIGESKIIDIDKASREFT